jgi:hypothetical protein
LHAVLFDRHAHRTGVLRLSEQERFELYYTLLLKDLGCSGNAARICELYRTDDLYFKRGFKEIDGSLPQVIGFVLGHTGLGAGFIERFRVILASIGSADAAAQDLTVTRCERGAAIARRRRFSERVAAGIHSLDEHWNGKGRPERLAGENIPLYARIAARTRNERPVRDAAAQRELTDQIFCEQCVDLLWVIPPRGRMLFPPVER